MKWSENIDKSVEKYVFANLKCTVKFLLRRKPFWALRKDNQRVLTDNFEDTVIFIAMKVSSPGKRNFKTEFISPFISDLEWESPVEVL